MLAHITLGDTAALATLVTLLCTSMGTLLIGLANRRRVKSVGDRVDGVHNEVRPPSNGTTNGAYAEGMSFGLAMGLPWIIEELVEIRHLLGSEVHSPPPDTSVFINPTEVQPPDRPKEHPWPPPRPPRTP